MTRIMFDAAYPPANPPAVDAVAFYIGGNTPHVWSDAQIAHVPVRYRLPIFTRSVGGDPTADANAAAHWCRSHAQPKGTLVMLDFETRQDTGYVHVFDAVLLAAGWRTVLYGSASYVYANARPSGGYCPARWDGNPDPGHDTMKQYAGDVQLRRPWDLSAVSDSAPLWDTHSPAPTPIPTPVPANRSKENDMHIDLKSGEAHVFTNPTAVVGGTSTLVLSSDFQDASVRVAIFDQQGNPAVTTHAVLPHAPAVRVELGGCNKVSLELTAGSTAAADVYVH